MESAVLVSSWSAGKLCQAFYCLQGCNCPKVIIYVKRFIECLIDDWHKYKMYLFYFYLGEIMCSCRTLRCPLYTGGINVTKFTIRNLTCHYVCTKWEWNILSCLIWWQGIPPGWYTRMTFGVSGGLVVYYEFWKSEIAVICKLGECVRTTYKVSDIMKDWSFMNLYMYHFTMPWRKS